MADYENKSKDALARLIYGSVDGTGDSGQIKRFRVDSNGFLSIGQAESGIPDEATDGDSVSLWIDQYGRIVVKGYNLSEDALNVVEQAPEGMQTLEFIDDPLLDAVTATGASFSVDVSPYNRIGVQIVASGVSSGATVDIESSHNGSNWAVVSTNSITSNGTTDIQLDGKFKFLRANVSSRSDGTITVSMIAGR